MDEECMPSWYEYWNVFLTQLCMHELKKENSPIRLLNLEIACNFKGTF